VPTFTLRPQHKARVLESRKEDQESLMEHLFELERARGYSSDFQTFQGMYCMYNELLQVPFCFQGL